MKQTEAEKLALAFINIAITGMIVAGLWLFLTLVITTFDLAHSVR